MTKKPGPSNADQSSAGRSVAMESPNNSEQSSAATKPLVAAASPTTVMSLEEALAIMKGPVETASYNDATRHLANAWKPELQFALEKDVYYAEELKETLRASILKLTPKKSADPDATSRKNLENDVVTICTAATLERFATKISKSPAGKRATENEIRTSPKLSNQLAEHIESMHQTSLELVEENLPAFQLKLLNRAAASVSRCFQGCNKSPCRRFVL